MQHVYIYMDDSGKISKHEEVAIFAGIIFNTNEEKSAFFNKYNSILKDIKCKYCTQESKNCNCKCIEIKGNSNLNNSDRRRFIQLSKQFKTFATVIFNRNLFPEIINCTSSKGRFIEYSQRRVIKSVIEYLIQKKIIDPEQDLCININIDEMPTKSNGYYSLEEGLYEELAVGIKNFNYGKQFPKIVNGNLKVKVVYKDSRNDLGIQMADIIANSIHRAFVFNSNWFETKKYLKKKLGIKVLLRLPN